MPETTHEAPRRRWLKWIVAVPIAIVALAWIALAVALPPAKLRALVQKEIGSFLAREVRFADARILLWPPVRLEVSEPAMAEPGGFAKGAAFRARSIDLDLDVLGLLVRRLVVRRLAIDRPVLHLVLRADGSTNLDSLGAAPPSPAQPSRPAATMDLAVSSFVVRQGQLLIDDLAARRRTAFGLATRTGFALEGRSGRVRTHGESHLTDLRLGPLSAAREAELNGSFARLDWKIDHAGTFDPASKRLAIERLALGFGRTAVTLGGAVDLAGKHPIVNLSASGRGVDLGEILGYLSAADARALSGIRGDGQLAFDLAIRGVLGTADRPLVLGTVSVRNGTFEYSGAPVGLEKTSFDARLGADSLAVTGFQTQVSGQTVRGDFEAARLADPLVRFALAGNIDLAAVSRFIARQDTRIEGRAALDVSGHGRAKDLGSLSLAGWAKLANVSVLSPQLPKRMERIGGELHFSPERATIQHLTATAGQSSFTLDASATRPLALLAKAPAPGAPRIAPSLIDFTLTSNYLDLAELLPPTPGGPLLPNARGHGTVAIRHLKNQRLDVSNVNARVDLEPTEMLVPQFTLSGYGGSVHGNARFGLENPAKPKVTVKATIDTAQADALLAAWSNAGKILHGVVGTTLELSTDGIAPADIQRSLTAIGLAKVVNGALGPAQVFESIASFTRIPAYREVRFRDVNLPFKVENGRVATGPARLLGTYGEWLVSGTVGFDGSLDYAASVTVPPEMVSRLGAAGSLAAGALRDPSGRVLLDLRIGGTAKSPRVAWDTKAMRTRLLGGMPSALLPPQLGIAPGTVAPLDAATRAAQDSANAAGKRMRRALEDSLKKEAGKLFRGLFGGGQKDTSH